MHHLHRLLGSPVLTLLATTVAAYANHDAQKDDCNGDDGNDGDAKVKDLRDDAGHKITLKE